MSAPAAQRRAPEAGPGVGPVTAVVFDFGGPVIRLPFELQSPLERRLGLAPGSLAWGGPFDPESDPSWQEVLSGRGSERAYWAGRAREIAPHVGGDEIRDLFQAVYGDTPAHQVVRAEASLALAAAQRAGLRTAVLTNDIAHFHPRWHETISFLSLVDVVVDGSLTGVLKPDPAAYRLVLEALGTCPEQTVFVDDQPVNVEGARAVGLPSVLFDLTDVAGSYQELAALAGLPGEF